MGTQIKDVPVGSQVKYNNIPVWVCVNNMGGFALFGWKPDEDGGDMGWGIDNELATDDGRSALRAMGCDRGWWVYFTMEVEIIFSPIHSLGSLSHDPGGMPCARCQTFYPYAVPNRPSGKMVCWSCRQGYVPENL